LILDQREKSFDPTVGQIKYFVERVFSEMFYKLSAAMRPKRRFNIFLVIFLIVIILVGLTQLLRGKIIL